MFLIEKGSAPLIQGIGIGSAISLISGLVYLTVFQGAGSLFCLFALLCFFIGPLSAGFVTVKRLSSRKTRAFVISAMVVLGIALVLFLLTYAIGIVFLITTVNLATTCDNTYQSDTLPASITYTFPGGAEGVLVSEDMHTAIVTRIDYISPQHPGTVFLINKTEGKVLWSIDVPSDNIAAAMDDYTVYIFHHGIGYFINKNTGKRADKFLSMDNYGTNTNGKFQTTGIISTWNRDGTVKSLNRLTFNGIVHGCLIRGDTGDIIKL